MTVHNTVAEYCEYAAQEFLQTVVFIDDRIFGRTTGTASEPGQVSAPKRRKRATKTAEGLEETSAVPVDSSDESSEYSPYEVVTSFAKKQIICSLYQPTREAKASRTSDVVRLCRAADVVIVDWDLYGDNGAWALELIEGLIRQAAEDEPEQLRLIMLYTQEVNLQGIASQIYDGVRKVVDDFNPVEAEEGLAFHTTNSRVKVFGKSGRPRPGISKDHVIDEKELANATIRQFAILAHGLLQVAVLRGLAEIRKNSRKVLSRFDAALDPAFLTHVAMSPPEEDALSHVIPLLVSEIESVLEDVLPAPLLPQKVIQDWCRNVWQPGDHLDQLLGGNSQDVRALAESICLKGFKVAKGEFDQIPGLTKTSAVRKVSRILPQREDDKCNQLFSHLMSSRSFYGPRPKMLTLGTIVYEEDEKRYLLCLQPVCDTVRLRVARSFMFAELQESDSESGNLFHVSVVGEKVIELSYEAKAHRAWIACFLPDASAKCVVAETLEDGRHVFRDASKRSYCWIDQMKPAHAQRAVGQFASDISRVGLTESEWLRLLGNDDG